MSREVRLLRYPAGAVAAADFALADAAVADLAEDEVAVAVAYLSMDPVVRTRMTASPAMGPPLALGACVPGRGVGRVVASRAPLAVGAAVYGDLGWRETAVLPASTLEVVQGDAPLHHHLNALGPAGLAAYFLVEAVFPQASDTVFIAPGAGAVGSLVAQLALHVGRSRVFGTAVGAAQADYLRSLGVEPVGPGGALPGGIDIFIDGVGGDLHDRAMQRLNPRARVRLLGFLSDYGSDGPPRYGNMGPVLMKRALVEGFLLADHMARADHARERLAGFIASGALTSAETIWDGLDAAPHAFAALFAEAGPGKQLVRVRDMT